MVSHDIFSVVCECHAANLVNDGMTVCIELWCHINNSIKGFSTLQIFCIVERKSTNCRFLCTHLPYSDN